MPTISMFYGILVSKGKYGVRLSLMPIRGKIRGQAIIKKNLRGRPLKGCCKLQKLSLCEKNRFFKPTFL